MNCPVCGTESKGKFCGNCGHPLQAERQEDQLQVDEPLIEAAAQSKQEAAVGDEPMPIAHKEHDSVQQQAEKEENEAPVLSPDPLNTPDGAVGIESTGRRLKQRALFATICGAVIAAIVVLCSIAVTWVLNRGSFFSDFTYHVLQHVLKLPLEQASYFSDHMRPGFWVNLVAMHGGFFQGAYTTSSTRIDFQLQVPILMAMLGVFFLVGLCSFLLRKRLKQVADGLGSQLVWLTLLSLTYGLLTSLIVVLFRPRAVFVFGVEQYHFDLWTQLGLFFIVATVLCWLAAAFGMGLGSAVKLKAWQSWVASVRSFFIMLLSFYVLIAGLSILSWSLTPKTKLYHPHIATMGSLWSEYNRDLGLYAILPNVLIQEQLYALGGTWHVDGPHAAKLLELPGPIQLSVWGGLKQRDGAVLKEGIPADWTQELESQLRWQWVHAAFLLAYLYALSKIHMSSIRMYACTTAMAIVVLTLASWFLNISFQVDQTPAQVIGYEPLQALIGVSSVTVVFLGLSFGIQRLWSKRGVKEHE